MKIWNKTAQLARLKMTPEEQNVLIPQVQKIIDFFHHIAAVPTDKIEPLTTPLEIDLPVRKDHPEESKKDLIQQAPSLEDPYVKAPSPLVSRKEP